MEDVKSDEEVLIITELLPNNKVVQTIGLSMEISEKSARLLKDLYGSSQSLMSLKLGDKTWSDGEILKKLSILAGEIQYDTQKAAENTTSTE
jgi:hypothetical protein